METTRRFVFTGGGTGGHVTPNLAMMREIAREHPDSRFLYVGTRRGAEREMTAKAEIPFAAVSARPFAGPRRPWACLRFLIALALGTAAAMLHILRFRPQVVVATGGYVSVPTVLAAALLRRRVFLHEQNVRPGKANRFLARFATRIGLSFEESRDEFSHVPEERLVVTGYPVREDIAAGDPAAMREALGIPMDHKVAFVVGGSMGARSINRATIEGLARLLEDEKVTVIHSTGMMNRGGYDAWEDTRERLARVTLPQGGERRYITRRFFQNIEQAYGASDLVVTRAGAGAIMELASLGKPALLVPKTDTADAHQLANAQSLKERGGAEVVLEEFYEEEDRTITRVHGDLLARKIREMLADEARLETMGRSLRGLVVPGAARTAAREVVRLADVHPSEARRSVQLLVGLLRDEDGVEHELFFNVSTIGHGATADVRLRRSGGRERALVRRAGSTREDTEYTIIPRRGAVRVDGEPVRGPQRLSPGAVVEIGPNRLVFDARVRTAELPERRGGILGRVVSTGVGTLASRLLGLVRMVVLGATFGAGAVMDVFAASLTIANLFRRIFAENAVDSAFLPSYVTLRRSGEKEQAVRLLRTVLTAGVVATTLVTILGILTLPLWLHWILPGFEEKGLLDDAITLTRWMMPYLVLVTLAATFSALLRAHNRFGIPAWSSTMYSVGVILGAALYPVLGLPGLGVGVLLGGVGQAAVHLPVMVSRDFRRRVGLNLRPLLALGEPGMRKVRAATPKILGDVAVSKISSVVDMVIVSLLAIGDPSALFFALILFQLPFALVSQSINTVALKEFSEWQAARDQGFCRRLVTSGITWNVFLLLPLSAMMVVLAVPIVELLLEWGSFEASDTRRVAAALAAYSIGLVGWGLTGLTGRFYAARLEIGQAMMINVAAVLVNVGLSLWFVFGMDLSFVGVALGTSIAFLANGAFRVWHLNRNLRSDGGGFEFADLLPSLQAAVPATLGAAFVTWSTWELVREFDLLPPLISRAAAFGFPALMGGLAYAVLALLLRSPEADEVAARFGRLLPRAPRGGGARDPLLNVLLLPARRLLSVSLHHNHLLGQASHSKLTARVRRFLESPDWRVRNDGVKLAGLIGCQTLRYHLARMIVDRRPAPLLHRLLGGDFHEPGFVRRNAVHNLRTLDEIDETVEQALLQALDDPYFEVRSAAARALAHFARRLSPEARERGYRRFGELIDDRNFEVAVRAVEGLHALAVDDGVLERLRTLHYHPNWQVRLQVVKAYHALYLRGIVEDPKVLLDRLGDILITCDSFTPTFELKKEIGKARNGLRKAAEEGEDAAK